MLALARARVKKTHRVLRLRAHAGAAGRGGDPGRIFLLAGPRRSVILRVSVFARRRPRRPSAQDSGDNVPGRGRRDQVINLRTFFSKCTPQALEYLDQHINEWIEGDNIKVFQTNQSYGIVEGKGGQKEPTLFVNVWYEKG
jgi:hypothetical protein